MMKVLVTGAHGFVGRNAALQFKQNGCNVTGIGLGRWAEESFRDFGIDAWIEADLTLDSLRKLKADFDVIVHCAGSSSVGFSLSSPMEDFQKTVDTTLYVLEYMRLHVKDCRLIYPSSAAVYGAKDDRPISEDDAISPVSPYGYHKMMAEELCESYSENFDLKVAIIRFFSLYGSGLKKQLLWDACNKFSAGTREVDFYGTGEETRDWMHIEDAVRLMQRISRSEEKFNIFNGGAGKRVTVREILELTAKEFGNNQTILFNGTAKKGDPRFYLADMSRAGALNWKAKVSLEEGIKDYVRWFSATKRV